MFGQFRNTENIVDHTPRLAGGVKTTSSAITGLDHFVHEKVRYFFDIFQEFFAGKLVPEFNFRCSNNLRRTTDSSEKLEKPDEALKSTQLTSR